jgi:hypothetical protein
MALKGYFAHSRGCQLFEFLELRFLNQTGPFVGEEYSRLNAPAFCGATEGYELRKVLIGTDENA